MKLQVIWFTAPIRISKGRLVNSISLDDRTYSGWSIDADYKIRLVSITDPGDDVPYEIPFENVTHFRRKKQAIVMDKVRNATRKNSGKE